MAREQYMVEVEFIVSAAAAASDAVLGAWARLSAYMAPRLLGGRLPGARLWNDETAMRRVQVSRSRMDEMVEADVASWDGEDLLISGYDYDGETLWNKKSNGGKAGNIRSRSTRNVGTPPGTPRGSPNRESQPGVPAGVPLPLPVGVPRGVPRRDSDSDCESESDQTATATPRAPAPDPRLAVVVALGGSLVGDDGIDLTERWLIAVAELSADEIRAVFREGPPLIGHGIRYPNGFTQAVTALRAATAAQRAEAAAAERAERATQDRERATVIAAAVDGWLASPDGAKTRARLTSTDRDALAVLRDAGELTGFISLSRRFPELARVAGEALKAAEASV